ncbi:ANTAR domain-containing protein [Isoptericola sp. NEAU-Y5]|uniref:ANTAR domain-containing protein n=1 Tax=Isoptericola luteus TaxID=2879484 RepID=A0ABS7ZE70_9MICO|nr:ANTAR domain-containing protein [Isoptericola sp. NEAU-Y5]MCA5893336.1 ANTAR domain-containing protein [Isoptericola sp. NEAU-Y5]
MRISSYPFEYARRAATILGTEIETSITVRQHGLTVRAGSSSDAAARCDQAESLADSGPCIDAMDQLAVRAVPDIAAEAGWQEWCEQAVREGFVSALAVPAYVDPHVSVALNLYSRAADPWTPELLTAADGYAQLVASTVRLHLSLSELEDAAAGFYRNMSDSMVVERAVGAIMQANGCTADQARRILGSASRHRNVTRREVAETILRALVVTEDAPKDREGHGA